MEKYCPRCDTNHLISEFYNRGKDKKAAAYCKKCSNKITVERMIQFKLKCVEYKGGKCIECGYNKYYGSMEFHHLDPTLKEFSLSKMRSSAFNAKIIKELDKCVLLCSNCHKEVEAGITTLNNL